MQLFSDLDGGILLSAAWQEYHGAIPYRDFHTAAPPLFLLPAGWAFAFWGPAYSSLIKLSACFSVITFLWSFLIIRDATKSSAKGMIYAAILQMVVVFPMAWWWYNETIWMGVALLLGSATSLLCNHHCNFFHYLSFLLACFMVSLLKVNLGAPALFLVFLLFMFDEKLRRFAFLAGLATLLFDLAFLAGNGISPGDLAHDYLSASSRINPEIIIYFIQNPAILGTSSQLVILFFLFIGMVVIIYRQKWTDLSLKGKFYALLVISLLIGYWGSLTNYQSKALGGTCLIMLFPFLEAQITSGGTKSLRWLTRDCFILLLALGLSGAFMGASRMEFYNFGIDSYAPTGERVLMTSPPLFANLRANGQLADVVSETKRVLTRLNVLGHPEFSVFFGPAIDFCYPAFAILPTKGLPLWWEKVPSTHRGEQYPFDSFLPAFRNLPSRWIPPGEPFDPYVQTFLKADFDVCVFRKFQDIPVMSYIPGEIRAQIYENYDRHDEANITVFVKRGGPVSSLPLLSLPKMAQ